MSSRWHVCVFRMMREHGRKSRLGRSIWGVLDIVSWVGKHLTGRRRYWVA